MSRPTPSPASRPARGIGPFDRPPQDASAGPHDEPKPPGFRLFAIGGMVLAACSGLTNAQTMLSVVHLPTTHMTGNLTHLSLALAAKDNAQTQLLLSALGAFLMGAAITGASIESTRLALGRRYGVILLGCGLALGAGPALFNHGFPLLAVAMIAMASGTQNALATRFSSAIVRTTHMTGIVTDLGIAIGKALAGRPVTGWRVQIYACLLTGFTVGGSIGFWMYDHLGVAGLFVPAALLGIQGIIYLVWRIRFAARQTTQHRNETAGSSR